MKRLSAKEKTIFSILYKAGFKIKVFWYDNVFSTMDLARSFNREELAEHTLMVSDIQTGGRGRFGRSWDSTVNDLTFSLILKHFDFNIPYSMIAAYSVWQSFRLYTDKVRLKWINDVLWSNGKKISGSLVEEYPDRTVIGVGINLNRKSFPPELTGKATSYYIETGKEIHLMDFLFSTLDYLFKNLEIVEKGNIDTFLTTWEALSEIKGKNVQVIAEGGIFKGKVKGINLRTGALLLECYDGREMEIYDGTLEILL